MKNKSHRDRIPSEELTAYERWELPLLDEHGNQRPHSREEEREVKPLTAADLEAIRQEAWQDGHKEGREAGYAEGLESGRNDGLAAGREEGTVEGREQGHSAALDQTRDEVQQRLAQLESVMAELVDPIQRHEDELEIALFNLATVLARAVVYRELKTDSSQIKKVVHDALSSLPSTRENVLIRVNPADREWVAEVADRFEAESRITEDDAILPGGCKVETRHSLVDFTIEKRFQKAVQRMLDQQLDGDPSGDNAELDAMMGDLTDFHGDLLQQPEEASEAPPSETSTTPPEHPSIDDSEATESRERDRDEPIG
ncbi:flagellar assembly protein FliH [Marinobacter sp. BGYM27]|uniref:flagellar assembly protein FliH n=1 Tax=unclassified Marinobacter TaxID=83889 RepID=UPI0021A36DD6|nr:flagellar assembly protein FliH [Marinobacter sp. BGYM27]MDG5498589.1 flagellar assembly protein FliH [Marinobacter sp. BGYM27]